jgi:hypothetical protein
VRPLPDLSPIADVGDVNNPLAGVFDPVADDFTQLLSDQTDTFDSLQAQLEPPALSLYASITALQSVMQDIGYVFDWIAVGIPSIANLMISVDYTSTIADVLTLESDFYGSLDSYNPDIATLAAPILDYLLRLLVELFQGLIDLINTAITLVIQWVYNLIAGIFVSQIPTVYGGTPTFI